LTRGLFYDKKKILQFLFKNAITGLTIFFCIGVLILLVNFLFLSEKLIETQAINNVKNTAQILKKASNMYSINVEKKNTLFK